MGKIGWYLTPRSFSDDLVMMKIKNKVEASVVELCIPLLISFKTTFKIGILKKPSSFLR